MTELFYWIMNMSIAGTIVALIILLLRKIKRIPRRFICFLWLLPLIRLCIPFGLPSRYSMLNLISKFTTKSVPINTVSEYMPELYLTNYIMAANSYRTNITTNETVAESTFTFKTTMLERFFSISSIIWIIVFAAGILMVLIIYQIAKFELKDSIKLNNNVYISDKVSSPALYGIFKPKIIIPPGLHYDLLFYIEAHENAHRCRGDNITRLIALIIACLHWFNPFIWIMLKCWLKDTELACDETVIQRIGADKIKSYASALITCAEKRISFVPAFSALGGAKIKHRIDNIISYQKITFTSTLAFITLLATLSIILLTNAN